MTTHDTAALVRQMRDVMMDARDDVQTELQRCCELAGGPQTDRRLAAQEDLEKRVDDAIAAADQWLEIQPADPLRSAPLHITGPDGRSLRVTRQYWHEGILCVTTEAWPEPRTLTADDLADCGLLSELEEAPQNGGQ